MILPRWTVTHAEMRRRRTHYLRHQAKKIQERRERRFRLVGLECTEKYLRPCLERIQTKQQWEHSEITRLKNEMGLTWEEWDAARRVSNWSEGTRRERGIGSKEQRFEFLRHWMGEVKKQQWYRWEKITFRL